MSQKKGEAFMRIQYRPVCYHDGLDIACESPRSVYTAVTVFVGWGKESPVILT